MFTGSFDPVTKGHIDIVKRLSKMYDSVVVVIAENPEKKYMFSPELRKQFIEYQIPYGITNVSVDIVSGLVADYALSNGVNVIVKGTRNMGDYTVESTMADYNRDLGIETVFMPCSETFRSVSSSGVKVMIKEFVDISWYVSLQVKHNLEYRNGFIPIGIVGNTGSGKSTVTKKLVDLLRSNHFQAESIDLDKMVHDLYDGRIHGGFSIRIKEELTKTFGESVVVDGKVDRKALGDIVFTNASNLVKLNEIMKPAIRFALRYRIKELVNGRSLSSSPIFILLDAPILAENGSLSLVNNNVIHVKSDRDICIQRIMERDGITLEKATRRYDAQTPPTIRDVFIQKEIDDTGYGALLTLDGTDDAPYGQFIYESLLKMGMPNND